MYSSGPQQQLVPRRVHVPSHLTMKTTARRANPVLQRKTVNLLLLLPLSLNVNLKSASLTTRKTTTTRNLILVPLVLQIRTRASVVQPNVNLVLQRSKRIALHPLPSLNVKIHQRRKRIALHPLPSLNV